MSSELLPPAQPAFILRGHSDEVHALHFTQGNARLLTADADGWVVSWNLAFKRPVAAWRAHAKGILGLGSWGPDRVITHGRDNQLLVWQLGVADEDIMSKTLPVDASAISPQQPWLLHKLHVNTQNFCPFAMCRDGLPQTVPNVKAVKESQSPDPILITVPSTVDSHGIDIYHLPSQQRAANISRDRFTETGMVMALGIQAVSARVQVAAGYESGHTMVFVQNDPGAIFQKLYSTRSHVEPVLSIAISPCRECYITSSVDAIVAKHPLPLGKSIWKNTEFKPIKVSQTKHASQQGLNYRSDGKIFATAGWDSSVRIYSGKTMKEVAVLKWHKVGCQATTFATINTTAMSTAILGPGDGNEAVAMTTQQSSAVSTVQQRRDRKAQNIHWLAAGSKDGKVSLWDIY